MGKLRITLEMVKIEHTLFALPFALMGAFFAAGGFPRAWDAAWILVAMVGARSAAMAFNRLVDMSYDSRNPRTAARALPAGLVSRSFVVGFVVAASSVFILAARMLNTLAFALSPVALALVFFYSYTKRFTWLAHFVLGLSLACAPVGAWIAIRGNVELLPVMLGLAVVLWVAGLDIIYACQDVEFDRRELLHSVPKQFGIAGALWLSALLHLAMVVLLAVLFVRAELGAVALGGLALTAVLLAWEHSLVRPSDLRRVNTAFFTINGWISILLFLTTSFDIIRRGAS